MVRFFEMRARGLDERTRDKLLFVVCGKAACGGGFSASTESVIDKDLGILETKPGARSRQITQMNCA